MSVVQVDTAADSLARQILGKLITEKSVKTHYKKTEVIKSDHMEQGFKCIDY